MGKIYRIINSVNSKVYIGKTIKSLNTRFSRHLINADKKINRCWFYWTAGYNYYWDN